MSEDRKIDKAKQTRKQHWRPTIGLMAAGRLEFEYNATLLTGIHDMAVERDANLICFAGGLLRSPYRFNIHRNVLYNLINAENVDGLIVMSSLLCVVMKPEELQDFLKRYESIPMVSIGLDLEGIPSVVIDNEKGFRDSIVHLIEVHGYRRIAFIRGPKNNPDAEVRYRVFMDVMAEYGLHVDNNLIDCAYFAPMSGVVAIHHMFSRKKIDYSAVIREYGPVANITSDIIQQSGLSIPDNIDAAFDLDAVVASSDTMAIGAVVALQTWGVRVPNDIAVTGFDDMKAGRTFTPPLSTVRQPIYEQGQRAVEILLEQISGRQVDQQEIMQTEFVLRQSCGCMSRAALQPAVKSKSGTNKTSIDICTTQRETIITKIIQALEAPAGGMVCKQGEQLVDAFCAEVQGGVQGTFLAALNNILLLKAKANKDITVWYKALSVIREYIIPSLDSREVLCKAYDILYHASVLIGETTQRVEAYKRLQQELQNITLFDVGQDLITTFELNELVNIILHDLLKLNILSCYISLYEKPEAPEEWARLILAYNEKGPIRLETSTRRFPARQLVPADFLTGKKRNTLVVNALYFREEQIGFALFEMSSHKGIVFEILRGQLSSSLKGVLLFQERDHAQAAVEQKAKELARSNKELEQFAYMASHDLQEPLRKVIFFSKQLKTNYSQILDDKGRDYFERIKGASERMQAMIRDLLSLSQVTTHAKPLVLVNLGDIAREAVSDLEIRIKDTKASVEIGDLPAIQADPVQMRQLFANLTSNALKYHRPGIEPSIKVYSKIYNRKKNRKGFDLFSEASESPGSGVWCRIFIQDNGIGFDEKFSDQIFLPFKRLHTRGAYEGLGIGLAICHKIVERHRGTIRVKSKKGEGTTFIITLPVNEFSK